MNKQKIETHENKVVAKKRADGLCVDRCDGEFVVRIWKNKVFYKGGYSYSTVAQVPHLKGSSARSRY